MTSLNLLMVMLGGAVGALGRHLLVGVFAARFAGINPIVTILFVNVLGCFLIGLLVSLVLGKTNSEWLRLFVIVGLLGSFTTVSTFSLDTVNLLLAGDYFKAILNIMATLVFCLLATLAGLLLTRNLMS